jgi:hypothetical protein
MRSLALLLVASCIATSLSAQDADRSVAGGGISAPGWKGRIDRKAAASGKTIKDSKFMAMGNDLHLTIGPAGDYWRDTDVAKGDYEVKATFTETKMTASHPHSFGLFIGGAGLDTDTESLMYCIVYGNGTYAVKTFHGAKVTTLAGPVEHAAVKKADAAGKSTNTVGWRVKGGTASCVVNGTAVQSFEKAVTVGPDKLASTDGIFGIRVTHNVDLTVSGMGMVKGK